jgi:hypothetical protein
MKRVALVCILIILLLIFVFYDVLSQNKLGNTLSEYKKILTEGIPDDLKLTIYYLNPALLTRAPIRTLEQLRGCSQTKCIEVYATQLEAHENLLKNLDDSDLQPLELNNDSEPILGYLRLVYIMELENSEMLLEVMASDLVYGESILVNGFEVENNPIFYDLICPFLSEKDKQILERSLDVAD